MIDVVALHYMYRWYLRPKSPQQSPMSKHCLQYIRAAATNLPKSGTDVKQSEVCSTKEI